MSVRALRRGSIAASRVQAAPGGGTLTHTPALASAMSSADVSSAETASFTPTAGSRVLLWCVSTHASPVPTVTATASNGMTITEVASSTRPSANDVYRITLLTAVGVAVAGTVTFTFPDTQTGTGYYIHEYMNLGTPTVRQSNINNGSSSGGSVTLGSAVGGTDDAYATVGGVMVNASASITPGTDFTELYEVAYATPTARLFVEHDLGPVDNVIDHTKSASVSWAAIGVELGP